MTIFSSWAFNWDDARFNLPQGSGLCLDVGCGDGHHRDWVETLGWTWVGLDLDITRGGAIVVGDALQLPLADGSFEMVLLWQVLEHLPQPWTALSEVSRVLKSGGRVVGSVSCLEPFHDVCQYFGFTHKGLERVLADCGFVDIEVRPGLNAFSLIARSWLRRLLGAHWGEQVAFALVRISFVCSLQTYLILRRGLNLLRRGRLGMDYLNTVQWLTKDAPIEFAGHLQFLAHKRASLVRKDVLFEEE
ncbi:MAG: methyltransferase domain-containing protein [Dehalococcoidia bacterium]|nr:methyltransferase domain-containing protein [Dehalococcoidia bacterium]